MSTTEFDPMAVRKPFAAGHNGGPALDDEPEPTPFELVTTEINDLFDEAKNFADGQPIDSEELHDAISKLYDALHAAGKRADELRVEEKKPHDDAAKAVQARYAPLIKEKTGKVAMGKSALGDLLAVWRKKKADEAAAEAKRVADIAAAEQAKAQAALQSSFGNLEARAEAEQQVETAKAWGTAARRADKAATTGLGLRTVWTATLVDAEAGLNWAYERDPARFTELVQQMGAEAVRGGLRAIPGFTVEEEKRAA